MLTRIAAFEMRYQIRSPLFGIGFAIFFLLSFASVVIDEIQTSPTSITARVRL